MYNEDTSEQGRAAEVVRGMVPTMHIDAAQNEMRSRYCGGCYGQLASAALWLAAAGLATWGTPRAAITTVVLGGFLIFPVTEGLARLSRRPALSPENSLRFLGMQVAFVLPLSMPLLLPVARHRLTLFFPALMILLGAHYVPFVFLYRMRAFAVLAGALLSGGVGLALYGPESFAAGAWYTAGVLLVFSAVGWAVTTGGHAGGGEHHRGEGAV